MARGTADDQGGLNRSNSGGSPKACACKGLSKHAAVRMDKGTKKRKEDANAKIPFFPVCAPSCLARSRDRPIHTKATVARPSMNHWSTFTQITKTTNRG